MGLPSFSIYHLCSRRVPALFFFKIGRLNSDAQATLTYPFSFLSLLPNLSIPNPPVDKKATALCSATSLRKVSLHTKRGYSWELHKKCLSSLTGMLTGYWVFCEQSSRVLHSLHLAIHRSQTKWWRVDFHFIHTCTLNLCYYKMEQHLKVLLYSLFYNKLKSNSAHCILTFYSLF